MERIEDGTLAKFSTPEEELEYLRAEVARKESLLAAEGKRVERDAAVSETVKAYAAIPAAEALAPEHALPAHETGAIVLDLAPETHDRKIEELLGILEHKGVHNALSVVLAMDNPHIADDFHRVLVEFVKKGLPVQGLKERTPLSRSLHMALFEVALPDSAEEGKERTLKEIVSSMEQLYGGMLSVADANEGENKHFTIELANANGSHEFVFYAGVPRGKAALFEKQAVSVFPNARVSLRTDDYNVFSEGGVVAGSVAKLSRNGAYPLKTYEAFDLDPLNVILNSFSKIDRDGEGAAIQLVFSPAGETYQKRYRGALDKILAGTPAKEALDIPVTFLDHFGKAAKDFVSAGKKKPEAKEGEDKKDVVDQIAAERVKAKIATPIVEANIRIIASAASQAEADAIVSDIESAFNQFEDATGNKLSWTRLKKGGLRDLSEDFSYRNFDKGSAMPLSLRELTTVMHFPTKVLHAAPQLRQARASTSAAPSGMPVDGTMLGVNLDRNVRTEVRIGKEDRLRHLYVIGQTGTGKTSLLKNMIVQDIRNGEGVCMIDPHGSDIEDILASIPKERHEDVVYFDPGDVSRPLALNMLEYDRRFPEQKTFVVNEMLSIFNKLFDMKTAGGPMFEQYFRNAVMLVLEDPDSGSTLLDVSRVLADKAFREAKLAKCANPIVSQFWREVAGKAGGEASLANIVPYITSKFDTFLSNDIMRPIIAQQSSAFDFRKIMDERKILLVNLSKGRLGDINSHLIGLILVGKILMAALSRVDSFGKDMPHFYLYIDEFQNVTTDSISTILSEARKYKLSLNVAHQFIAQLDDKIRDSVFGNVGSIAAFRVGAEDAEYLGKQFAPVFKPADLMNLDNHNAYLKVLVNGRPAKPFNIETVPPGKGNPAQAPLLKELSSLKYGRPQAEVEAEIAARYKKP